MHEKHTKTRKGKNPVGWTPCSTSPVPHTKLSKINEIHEKGDRGRRMGGLVSSEKEGFGWVWMHEKSHRE